MKPSRQEKIKAVEIAKTYIDAGFNHVLKNELYFSDWIRDFGNPLSSCKIASGMTKYVIISGVDGSGKTTVINSFNFQFCCKGILLFTIYNLFTSVYCIFFLRNGCSKT